MALTVRLNILHVAIVERGEVGASFPVGAQEPVELGVEGLGIGMLGSVNEQRHRPCRQLWLLPPNQVSGEKSAKLKEYSATGANAAGCVVNSPTRVGAMAET
jgi:hypothetical protein